MQQVLAENGLYDIAFTVRFVDQIMPDPRTGKKPLIIQFNKENDHENEDHR